MIWKGGFTNNAITNVKFLGALGNERIVSSHKCDNSIHCHNNFQNSKICSTFFPKIPLKYTAKEIKNVDCRDIINSTLHCQPRQGLISTCPCFKKKLLTFLNDCITFYLSWFRFMQLNNEKWFYVKLAVIHKYQFLLLEQNKNICT